MSDDYEGGGYAVCFVLGLILCFTIIGAILGLPMMYVGFLGMKGKI